MIDLKLFGTVSLEQDGQRLRKMGSQKSIAMLAYLVARKQAISRTHLADLLWMDKSESTGRQNVRWSLNHLSKMLPNNFISQRETIQFEPSADITVDILTFDKLRNKGDFDSLASALEHYHGEFMEGFFLDDCPDFEQWILQERDARQQQIIQVMERLITYYTQFGQYFHVFELINRLLEIEPWREDMHRRKMYYLALKGNRGAALKHFEFCCDILETQLNISPESKTLILYEYIRDEQDLMQYDEFSQAPSPIIEVTMQSLPIQTTQFIGRDAELQELCQLIQDGCRLLTLVGQGGIGKTRLAIEIAQQLTDSFDGEVYFVSLTSITKPAEIPLAIAESIGYNFMPGTEVMMQLLNFFADRHCLLILDNFEHLITGINFIHTFLNQVPNLYLLVSSRIRLNLPGEYVYEVMELESHAVMLFLSHMSRIIPKHNPTKQDITTIQKICTLTGGVPLALELAASWVNSLTLAEIVTELQHNIDLLAHNRINVAPHHRSIRATFEYTWQLLSEPEQMTVARLSIFKGGCTRDAARYITETNLYILSSLVDKSILRHDSRTGRYTMHELQRQFAIEKLHAVSDVAALNQRHAMYFANMLHQSHEGLYSRNLPEVCGLITADINNIRHAWEWSVQHEAWSIIEEAVHPLGRYYQVMCLFEDGETVFNTTLQQTQANKLLTAQLHQEYSAFLTELGKTQQAVESAQMLIQIAQTLNQMQLQIVGYLNWGKALWHEGDINSAKHYLEQALALEGDNHSSVNHYTRLEIMRMMGMIASRLGDYQSALEYYDTCLHDLDDMYNRGQILRNIGSIYRNIGNYDLAEDYYSQALNIYQQINNPHGKSAALNGLGDVAFYRFNYQEALEHYNTCLEITHKIGDRRGESVALNNIGTVLQSLGRYDEARSFFEQSIQKGETIDFQRGIAWSQCCLGLLHHQNDANEQALQLCEAAYETFYVLGDILGQCFSTLYLGHVHLALKHIPQAYEKYQRAMTISQSFNRPPLSVEIRAGLARTFLLQDHLADALAQVEVILQQSHTFNGTYEPFRIYQTCYDVLYASQDARANDMLKEAKHVLESQAAKIDDEVLRQIFLDTHSQKT